MGEITTTGYNVKSQNDWFAEEQDLYLDIDSNWNIDPSTPDGLKIAHDSEVFSAMDETVQQAYNSKDPNKASGYDLDVISAITGTTRSEGTASTISDFVLTGVVGKTIPAGTRFESTTTGYRFTLDQEWTIPASGSVSVGVTCTTLGEIEAEANTVTEIVDAVDGLVSATNPNPATTGTAEESDSSLRLKRATAVGRPGNNQVDSIYGELYAVDGVRKVKIYENDTSNTDTDGLPPHSVASIVDGGEDEDVAMALYIKKNPGVEFYVAATEVSVVVTSPVYPTNTKTIKFSRPTYVDMVIEIVVKDDGTLPSQTVLEPLVQNAYVEYGEGDLIPADVGFKITGFGIGESVPYSSLFTPINKVLGVYGNSYVESLTVNGTSGNIDIAFNELSRWTTANVSVTIS